MPATASTVPASGQFFRLDTDHHLQQLMQEAINRLQSGNVDVRLGDDSVVLNGTVSSWHDKQLAQESLRSISRSRVIQNHLQVVRR